MTGGGETTWATRTLVRDGVPASRTVRGCSLVVANAGGKKTTHRFAAEVVRVGSRVGADLVLTDASVSRLHFEIVADELGFRLHDLGSRNGTRLDGKTLSASVLLDRSHYRQI